MGCNRASSHPRPSLTTVLPARLTAGRQASAAVRDNLLTGDLPAIAATLLMAQVEPLLLAISCEAQGSAMQAGGLTKDALVACVQCIGEGSYATIRPSQEP